MSSTTAEVLGAVATVYGVGAAVTVLLQARQMLKRHASCDISARFFAVRGRLRDLASLRREHRERPDHRRPHDRAGMWRLHAGGRAGHARLTPAPTQLEQLPDRAPRL